MKTDYSKFNQNQRKKEAERKTQIKNWFKEYKKNLSCSNCGKNGFSNLEFHHRIPSEKKKTISELVSKGEPMERILDEIKKCDVLCKNCHKNLHSTKT